MATQVLTDCVIFLNQYDLSADVNAVDWDWEAAEVDCTNFASGGDAEYKAGLRKSKVSFMTFYDTATGMSEPVFTSLKGTTGNVLTVAPNGTDGDRAIFASGLAGGVKLLGKVGDMAKADGNFTTSHAAGLVEGTLVAEKQTVSSTAGATAYQLGAVSSTQTVYASAHVFSVDGTDTPTVTLRIQSDDNSGFTSATNRISFTAATAATSEFKSVAGPFTDDYWRAFWTVSGTGPSFVVAVAMAIV